MTFGGTSLSNLAGAFGRTFSANRSSQKIDDTDFDIYERAPVMRADIEAMLSEDLGDDGYIVEQEEKLRASEKHEHETMCLIRGALYPSE